MSIKGNILISLIILALLLFMIAILFGEKGYVELTRMKREKDSVFELNSSLMDENLNLYRSIDRLKHDPEFIKETARREIGLVEKEDIIIRFKEEGEKE